jgi:hypothetical protein
MIRFTASAALPLFRLCDTDTAKKTEAFGFAYSDTDFVVV